MPAAEPMSELSRPAATPPAGNWRRPALFDALVVMEGSIWRDWRIWVILAAETIGFGLVSLVKDYLSVPDRGLPIRWIFLLMLPSYLLNMIFVPLVWTVANRWRLHSASWLKLMPLHIGAAIVLALARIGGVAAIQIFEVRYLGFSLFPSGTPPALVEYYRGGLFLTYFVSYWAVIGLWLGFEHYRESERRLKMAAQLQSQLTEARIQALRGRLNPHFLFNTLNTISVFVLKGEREAVVDIIERLSRVLRFILDESSAQQISLRQEMEFIESYLDILRLRFADHLVIDCDVPPETRNAQVPALILQPLVENAVKHGGAGSTRLSRITIRARRVGDILEIEVADNGRGFPPFIDTAASGVGLSLTQSLLTAMWGSAGTMAFANQPEGGARVTLSMPFVRRYEREGALAPARALQTPA